MKVKELIEKLRDMPEEYEVWVSVWDDEIGQSHISDSVCDVQLNGRRPGDSMGFGYNSVTLIGE